ncbi:hypothetical protein FB446DRAFT_784982 [Lentinula raphanica]|nr:hypothetical protein FB446DRAFT_784982 [Lentinula raphanica]
MSFVQQPHSAEITPLGIPTFDHGVERRVYRYWSVVSAILETIQSKAQTPTFQAPGSHSKAYPRRPPLALLVSLLASGRSNNRARVFLGSPSSAAEGPTVTASDPSTFVPVCLNDIYKSVLALGPFPNPDYPPPPAPPPPPPPPPPPAIAPFPLEMDSSSPIPSSPLPSMASIPSPKPASPEPVDPQEIFDQIWAAFQEYNENPVQQELAQLFAGQHDVIVTPDGSIHYEPDLFPQNNALLPGQVIGDNAAPSATDREKAEDIYEPDADVTLVDIDLTDIKSAVGDGLFKKEWVPHGHGTQAQPYDLTSAEFTVADLTSADQKPMFIELCDACRNDVEDHNTAACVANLG